MCRKCYVVSLERDVGSFKHSTGVSHQYVTSDKKLANKILALVSYFKKLRLHEKNVRKCECGNLIDIRKWSARISLKYTIIRQRNGADLLRL